MVICLQRVADLHTVQLKPLPVTVSCFSKIQIGFTFLVLAHLGNNNNNSNDNVYGAVIMTKVIARAPGGRQPSDQANRLGL